MREWQYTALSLDVSVHCRDEGCIGKYIPRGPRDFQRAGDAKSPPKGNLKGPREIYFPIHPNSRYCNRWSLLSLGMTFVDSSRWQWNSAEFQFDRLQMNLNLKHKEYESLQCKGRLYSTKLWHKVFHYLVRILSPLTMHLFLLVHLISNQCKGQSPKERNMGHSMAYNVCSL